MTLACAICGTSFATVYPTMRTCSEARCRRRWRKRRGSDKRIAVLRPRIVARDGMVCHLCRLPILYDSKTNHPGALTLDHVIPVALGGSDSEDNLKPAHRSCNVAKGATLAA